MKARSEGYTMMREFIYGIDFSLFDKHGEILLMTTIKEVQMEIAEEYSNRWEQIATGEKEWEDDEINDLSWALCQEFDDKWIAFDNDGNEIATKNKEL
jgi:hypothetical protein